MGPEPKAFISGTFAGQKMALVLLVKVMHHTGALDGRAYVQALKNTFNDADAKFERPDYEYLRGLANSLEEELSPSQ